MKVADAGGVSFCALVGGGGGIYSGGSGCGDDVGVGDGAAEHDPRL